MGTPKLLIPIDGGTLFEVTLRRHIASRLRSICAVVPGWIPGFGDIAESHESERVKLLRIEKAVPMSGSLKWGWGWVAANLKPDAVMISLADKPLVATDTINLLIDAYTEADCDICVPVYRGMRGHPVVISSSLGAEVMAIRGDRGAVQVLAAHAERIKEVEVASDAVVFDVDAGDDVRVLRERLGASGRS